MDQLRPNNGLRVAGMALFSALALTACGGGGNGPSNSDPQAQPQSTSSHFAVIETQTANGSTATAQAQIVDLQQGTIAASYDLGAVTKSEYPSQNWATIFQATMDVNGLGYQQAGSSQLAMIQSGKVMLLDLAVSALGTPHQLSNITNACAMARESRYVSADGRHAWLRVTTTGPDGLCTKVQLVSLDMSPTDQAVPGGLTSGLQIVEPLQDKSGASANILVIDRDKATLAVFSNDLKIRRYDVTTPGLTLAGDAVARLLADSPVNYQQALVQIGGNIYLADWSGAQLALSNPIVTGLASVAGNSAAPVVIKSSDRFYVGDGVNGYAISADGKLLKQYVFPAERGTIVAAALTSNGVVVNQTVTSSSNGTTPTSSGPTTNTSTGTSNSSTSTATASNPISTLWIIDTSTGDYHEIVRSSGTTPLTLRSVQGDAIYYSQAAVAGSTWETLYKARATQTLADTSQTVFTDSAFVDYVLDPHATNSFNRVKKTLWCAPAAPLTTASYTVGCANGTLTAVDASTGQQTSMGTLSPAATVVIAGSRLFGMHDIWQNRNGVLALARAQDASHYAGDLYLINPDTGNSLKRVTPLP